MAKNRESVESAKPADRLWSCRSPSPINAPRRDVLADTAERAKFEYRREFQLHESRPVDVELVEG